MKYLKYITENTVEKALSLPEPKVGGDYAPEKVERYIKMIDAALSEMSKKEENDANDAIVQDLRDKKKKWKNVDKETKPVKTKQEIPPNQQEEPPPEEEQPRQEKPIEEKIDIYIQDNINEMAYKKGSKADKIFQRIVWEWEDWYFNDMPIKELKKELKKDFKITDKKAKFILDIWGDFKSNRINAGEFKEFIHDVLQGNKYYGP